MPPRKTTDFGALFESLIEDLRIQVAASVDRTLSDFSKRLARIERRLDQPLRQSQHHARAGRVVVSPHRKLREVGLQGHRHDDGNRARGTRDLSGRAAEERGEDTRADRAPDSRDRPEARDDAEGERR